MEVRLIKSDPAATWGFRLTGGANFEVPLTTIKVNENSIAEKCGLKVGDIIVKINDDDVTQFTHAQAHDKIIQSEGNLIFTVVRGELSDQLQNIIQEEESNEEIHNILEGTIPIDYPEKTIDDLIKDQENSINEQLLLHHDLNLTDEEIHNIISSEIVTKKEKYTKESTILESKQMKESDKNAINESITEFRNKQLSKEEVQVMQSEVIKEINNNINQANAEPVRVWSTFLQKPQRPVPKTEPKYQVQQSTYKVKIRTKKDLEAEREFKRAQEEAELLRQQEIAEKELKKLEEEMQVAEVEEESESESESYFTFSSDDHTETTITFTPTEEPTLSFTESLSSLEVKLENVKAQLGVFNIELVPESLQKTLSKIAAQLEHIVRVVKPAIDHCDKKEDVTENDVSDEELQDDDQREQAALQAPDEPSHEVKVTVMGDSQATPENADFTLSLSDNAADVAECDRTEFDVTEMHDEEEEPPKEEEPRKDDGKTSKKEKGMETNGPLTPLERPIILPGGRKWCAPDDAVRAVRHPSLTDEKIDQTISTYYEVISGKTIGINFLKYQPTPKNLDHLKNSEVYKMVHNMDEQPSRGIFTRPEKVVSEQDVQFSLQSEVHHT